MPSAKQMQLATFSMADTLIRGYSTHQTPTEKIRALQDGGIVLGKGIENSDAQNNAQNDAHKDAQDATPQQLYRCADRETAL